jgi:hypothetical protein
MAELRTCDECGRPISSTDARICPACGFPIYRQEAEPAGVLRRPEQRPAVQDRPASSAATGGMRIQPPPVEVLGPHCPACHHRGAARRVRCERCGAELWPGAAAPRIRGPVLPVYGGPAAPERPWLTPVLFTAAAVAAIVVVYALTYLIA